MAWHLNHTTCLKLYKSAYTENKEPQQMLTFDSQFRSGTIKQAILRSKPDNAPA